MSFECQSVGGGKEIRLLCIVPEQVFRGPKRHNPTVLAGVWTTSVKEMAALPALHENLDVCQTGRASGPVKRSTETSNPNRY